MLNELIDVRMMYLTDKERLKLHSNALFEELDTDNCGSLSHVAIRMMIEHLTGFDPTQGEVMQLIHTVDENKNAHIEIDEFYELFLNCISLYSTKEEMELASKRFKELEDEKTIFNDNEA